VKKTYLKSGLYSVDLKVNPTPAPVNSKQAATKANSRALVARTRTGAKAVVPERGNSTFPLPINYGATLIEKQRDFHLPFDIMHAWKHGLLRLTKQPEPFTKIRSSKWAAHTRTSLHNLPFDSSVNRMLTSL
jgi:hypothetical protein